MTHLGDTPRLEQLIGVIKVMLDAYTEEKLDRVYLVYNHFINTMVQKASFDQLLPLLAAKDKVAHHDWDYLYETRCRNGTSQARDDTLHRIACIPSDATKHSI